MAGNQLFAQPAEHVFLITFDGLRWEEVFGGAVDSMILNPDLTHHPEDIQMRFGAENKETARKKLLPWFWSTLAEQGQLFGNRWEGSKMNCSNSYWFSYPGYNEILTGASDPNIDSNDKFYNKNQTVLEWLNEMP